MASCVFFEAGLFSQWSQWTKNFQQKNHSPKSFQTYDFLVWVPAHRKCQRMERRKRHRSWKRKEKDWWIAFCSYKMSKRRPELDEFDSFTYAFSLDKQDTNRLPGLVFLLSLVFSGDFLEAGDLRLVRSACSPKILVPLVRAQGKIKLHHGACINEMYPHLHCMHPNKNIFAVAKTVGYTGNRSATFQLKLVQVMHLARGALASASTAAKRMLAAWGSSAQELIDGWSHPNW